MLRLLVVLAVVGALVALSSGLKLDGAVLAVDLDPVLVHLGPLAVSWYGLAVAAGLLVGFGLTLREARRRGLPTEPVSDLAPWVVVGGLAGARLLHVIDRWEFYAANPGQILAFQNGGLAILGAILGGAVGGGLAARRQRLPIRRLFDAIAPGLVLGQAIGRFGCLVTGDALGGPTGGTWGIMYLNPMAMAPERGVAYQPVFLYEQIWDLAIFAVLWSLRRRLVADGQLFALYLGLYAAGKFAVSFFRTETVWLWGLQEAQLVAVGMLVAALALAAWPARRSIWSVGG
ncbi:MAG: prolipoprotein diacylglyceryl transferase [Chloroflexi bacterium]|nr:prolipoprotein diacylglyceryl transferase [Chloroflexota bacterium]